VDNLSPSTSQSKPNSGQFQRRFTSKEEQQLRAEYESWRSLQEIADSCQSNTKTVRDAILRAGGTIRSTKDRHRRYNDAQEAEIVRRYTTENIGLTALGNVYGTSPATITNILHRHGIETRPGGLNWPLDKELEVVRRYTENKEPTTAIAETYGCSPTFILHLLKRHNVTMRHSGLERLPDDLVPTLVRMYVDEKQSLPDISEIVGWSEHALNDALRRAGVTIRTTSEACRLLALNEDFFANITTEEQAAYLGFISADGCVHLKEGGGSTVAITLHRQDRAYLEQMAVAMGAETAVRDYHHRPNLPVSKLLLCSVKMVRDLIALGVTPRKSLTIRPWNGPEHLMRHYWRGAVDGDGTLGIYARDTCAVGFCGSEAMVRAFAAFVGPRVGSRSSPRKYPNKNCWYVHYAGSGICPRIAQLLYADATVCLERKKAIADRMMLIQPKIIRSVPGGNYVT